MARQAIVRSGAIISLRSYGFKELAALGVGTEANRFQPQLVDPSRPVDLVVKFHGRLADHLDPEKPGFRRNYQIVIDA
jgi:hypothetical protein